MSCHLSPTTLLLLFALAGALSCHHAEDPQTAYQHARTIFVHGDLVESQREAEAGYQRLRTSDPEWAWKFKILEAESMLWRGMYPQVLKLLESDPPPPDKDSQIRVLILDAVANARVHDYPKAEKALEQADALCTDSAQQARGDLLRAHGVYANQRGDTKRARDFFQQSLFFARSHGDQLLEATALLNLGVISLQEHPDEAIDWSESADKAASDLGALDLMQNALGNLGWAYYRLGDLERAQQAFSDAEQRAAQLGDGIDELTWIRGAGRVYADLHNTQKATEAYRKTLSLAEQSKATDDIHSAQMAIAWLDLQTGAIDDAAQYADRALQSSSDHIGGLYASLVQGQVIAQRGDTDQARKIFESVEKDVECPRSLRWEAQHSLAGLYENLRHPADADREYRAAVATFEQARANVTRDDSQLSFFANGSRIYDDYIHFLVAQGKQDDALRWADHSRARTLSEGFSRASNGSDADADNKSFLRAPVLEERAIAAHAKAAILYYWLGEKQSYLWAITARESRLFTLPARREIEAEVERYRKALTGPVDVLQSANSDGSSLYRTLIAPAQWLLPKDARVFIIPDGSLNNINFETLIAPDPAPHFWIEDATITDASSLRMLNASFHRKKEVAHHNLLLIGNSIAPNDQYPVLPNAQAQMESVARHFPDAQRRVFSGAAATPASYAESRPDQFSQIHFVAHGIASRLSPLDSAIVLSKNPAETDSFKLYAREILRHPLHADLVTISACYGAGERAYSGEGLVGLAWAFLRAGAHNVVAGLWAVTDASTAQMMDRFYDELDKGEGPDTALRNAKLSLLHGSAFHNPFYWAPFQLYAGS